MQPDTITMEPAVLRLGCRRISANMITGMTNTGTSPVNSRDISRLGWLSMRAMWRITEYFASSEGWKLTGPRRSQRREPLSILPMPGTATSARSRRLNRSRLLLTIGFWRTL